jgi:DNA polymerase-3 subunit epsilon
MSIILFYDTETTGLPNWKLPSEDPSQPHITQLAAELWDEASDTVFGFMDRIIKPNGWTIPDDVAALTGITTERAEAEGIPIADAFEEFLDLWQRSTFRCGHNETFDMRMVRIELIRDGRRNTADVWKAGPAFCTQSKSTKIINLPPTEKMKAAKRFHAKSPNLGEAYKHFTGMALDGAHNAAVDLAACKTVYRGIQAHLAVPA